MESLLIVIVLISVLVLILSIMFLGNIILTLIIPIVILMSILSLLLCFRFIYVLKKESTKIKEELLSISDEDIENYLNLQINEVDELSNNSVLKTLYYVILGKINKKRISTHILKERLKSIESKKLNKEEKIKILKL